MTRIARHLVSACYLIAFIFWATWVHSAEPDRPLNVVFILADDLGWGDLGCYGQTKIPTPNIDALAARGMRFTQHYSGAPVCAPSRCVLMTGLHLGHAEVRGNRQAKVSFPEFSEGQHPLTAQARTLAQHFQDAGYRTGAFGKWGLGPVGSSGDPARKGFDQFFGYNCQAVAHSYFPGHLWRNAEKVTLNTKPIPGHKRQPTGEVKLEQWQGEQYAPHVMLREAENFIDENKARPFFLYLPFIEPHVAMQPPQELVEQFPKEWDTVEYRGEAAYLPHPRPHAGYAAMVYDLDRHVGRIIEKLREHQLEENTLVIFTSDNGATHEGPAVTSFHVGGSDAKFFNSSGGLRGYKGSVYEGGIRVPMIASLPGVIPAGATSDFPCYFADWFATLSDAVALAPPARTDGESFWRILKGEPPASARKPMVWTFPEYQGQVAVRFDHWKAVRTRLKTPKPGPWELYDLRTDPMESNSVAEQFPEHIDKAKQILRDELDANKIFPVTLPDLVSIQRQDRRPNVLVFLVDDLGYSDIGCNGSSFYETPNVDRLAATGLRFTNGYAACPVCSPTRASLMTGMWPQRTGITDYIGAPQAAAWKRNTALLPADYSERLSAESITLASVAKQAGYSTFFAGKWHLGPEGHWPENFGFDFNLGGIDRGGPYGGNKYFSPYGNPRLADGPPGEHLPDRLATETVKFLRDNQHQPFLAYLSFYSVHTPLLAREDLTKKYRDKAKRLNLTTQWGREEPRDVRLTQNHAVYAAMVEAMDQAVGKVLQELDRLDLADNTLVVFTSDNGGLSTSEGWPTSNLPLRGGKGWMYEGGIRVPWIVRWPQQMAAANGSTSDTPVTSPDLMATLLAALDSQSVNDKQIVDGQSLLPLLRRQPLKDRDLYWYYPHYGNQGGAPAAALRRGSWKWIHWLEDDRQELYDLANDPGEQRNLASERQELTRELQQSWDQWAREVGVRVPQSNPHYDPDKPHGRIANRPPSVN